MKVNHLIWVICLLWIACVVMLGYGTRDIHITQLKASSTCFDKGGQLIRIDNKQFCAKVEILK